MIRELELVCSKCGKKYTAENKIYYIEDFKTTDFKNMRLLCPSCIAAWQEYWQISKAQFSETDGVLYVDIRLTNGETYQKLDCTALDDIVALNIDVPVKAQKKLYQFYKKWYDKKMKDCLKSCVFNEAFMRATFTCETYGGEKYEDIAFRFNRMGVLETEKDIPENIKQQVVEKWNVYELMNTAITIDPE